jgi:cephalosporin-C deacetylase-like acetyl esterase
VFNNYPEIDKNKIFLHGKSLGGAVAVYSALMLN